MFISSDHYTVTREHRPYPPVRSPRNPLQLAASGTLNDINREPLPLLPEFTSIPPKYQRLIRVLGRPFSYPPLSKFLQIADGFLLLIALAVIVPIQFRFMWSDSPLHLPLALICMAFAIIVLTRRQYRRLYDAYSLGEVHSAPEPTPQIS